jgi:hypothetical protein
MLNRREILPQNGWREKKNICKLEDAHVNAVATEKL